MTDSVPVLSATLPPDDPVSTAEFRPIPTWLDRFAPTLAAFVVAAIAVIVLVGWATDNVVLKCVVPGMTSMKVNTAIKLFLLAVALQGVHVNRGAWRAVAITAIAGTIALCAATAAQYVFHVDLKIDNALFVDTASVTYPGRNAPATITCFTVVSIALLLLAMRRGSAVAQALLMAATTVPLATLGGYLYRAPGMYGSVAYPVIALNTAVALVLLCGGGLFVRPREGLMRVATSRTAAGSLTRRLLPLAITVPLGVGVFTLAGQRAELYGPAFGSALLVTGCVIFFAAAVWWAASLLYDAEQARDDLLVRERAARGRAEAALLARDQLLAVVSHELRTPLTPILLLATALSERTDLPDDVTEDLRVICEQVQAEAAVVSDLLDLVGLRQGQLRLTRKTLDLRDLVRTATAAAAAQLADRKIDLTVDLLATRMTHASADRMRLLQVLGNLLDNAAKFTPAGGRVIVRCLDGQPGANGSCSTADAVIEVQDTGVGIAPNAIERIFDPFEQADRSTTRKYGGLGLGLTISRMLVTLHGGNLNVTSAGLGQGATFRVRLSGQPAPVVPSLEPAPSQETLPGRSERRLHLLLVEDHTQTRNAIARLLRSHGYEVATAGTGGQAIELVHQRPTRST